MSPVRSGSPLGGAAVEYLEGIDRDLWFVDLHRRRKRLVTAGYKDTLAVATGRYSVEELASHGPAKTGEQQRSVLDGSKLRRAASLPEPVS